MNVTATKWAHGWELELDTGGVTQVRTLANAEQQVRDYLDTVDPTVNHDDQTIRIIPQIGPALDEALAAKAASEEAAAAQVEAARRMRSAVRNLRSAGLSMADTASVLGLSRGRVSQLMAA